MNRLQWMLRRSLYRMNHLQLVLLALALMAPILALQGLQPRLVRAQALASVLHQKEEQLALLDSRRSLAAQTSAPARKPSTPDITSLPETLRDLQQLAHQRGLDIVHASYRLEHTGAIYRYRINEETESTYKSVRSFLHDALQQYPTLGLDSLEMQQTADDPLLPVTRMELSLYFSSAEGAPSVILNAGERP